MKINTFHETYISYCRLLQQQATLSLQGLWATVLRMRSRIQRLNFVIHGALLGDRQIFTDNETAIA
ncbi:hypothetical protein HCU40_21365 (plasmid) [Pseudanabaena biceps]|nr:hypothetical protein [Pseudanabaena biceps]